VHRQDASRPQNDVTPSHGGSHTGRSPGLHETEQPGHFAVPPTLHELGANTGGAPVCDCHCDCRLAPVQSHSDMPGLVVRHCPFHWPPALEHTCGHFRSASGCAKIGPASIEVARDDGVIGSGWGLASLQPHTDMRPGCVVRHWPLHWPPALEHTCGHFRSASG
jgi:hypothetical protein